MITRALMTGFMLIFAITAFRPGAAFATPFNETGEAISVRPKAHKPHKSQNKMAVKLQAKKHVAAKGKNKKTLASKSKAKRGIASVSKSKKKAGKTKRK